MGDRSHGRSGGKSEETGKPGELQGQMHFFQTSVHTSYRLSIMQIKQDPSFNRLFNVTGKIPAEMDGDFPQSLPVCGNSACYCLITVTTLESSSITIRMK
jgi:hypothetical protein